MKVTAAVKAMEAQCMALARASKLGGFFVTPPASLREIRARAFSKREILAVVHERKVLGFVWVRPAVDGSRVMHMELPRPCAEQNVIERQAVASMLIAEALRRCPLGVLYYAVRVDDRCRFTDDLKARLVGAGMRWENYTYIGTEMADLLVIRS